MMRVVLIALSLALVSCDSSTHNTTPSPAEPEYVRPLPGAVDFCDRYPEECEWLSD